MCDVCHEVPRAFWTYGGGYFHRMTWGEYLCPSCWWWACVALGWKVMTENEEGRA